jgi:hypothetical protein
MPVEENAEAPKRAERTTATVNMFQNLGKNY